MDDLLKPKEACDILQINRMTLYALGKKGSLELIDINKGAKKKPRYRIKKQTLIDFIQKQTVNSTTILSSHV